MYQSRKKQIKWQFEFQIPENPQSQPIFVQKQNKDENIVPEKQQSEPRIEQQLKLIQNQGEKSVENNQDQEQIIQQNQSKIKKIIPIQTKSKNYYLQKKQIYLINDIQVCDQECQYSPLRKSQLYPKEDNAHQYTIEKEQSEQQQKPVLSNINLIDDDDLISKPLLLQHDSSQSEKEDEHQPAMKEIEEEFLKKITNLQKDVKNELKNDNVGSTLLKYLSGQLDQITSIRDNRKIIISKLIDMMKENVEKQNLEIKKQQDIVSNYKQELQSNKKSIGIQTPKYYEIEQNELPQLLGYQAQSIEQDLDNNQYIVTYLLKRGQSIITFKALKKIKQSEELNKIMMDFAEKLNYKQLHIIGLDLRISGYKNNFLPYEELIQSVISNRYSTEEGQLESQYISNIINLIPHMIKKLRQLEKQLFVLKEYGCLWTYQFSSSKIFILMGYRTILEKEAIENYQTVFRIDYDLITFTYEFQYDLNRFAILQPFYPLRDITDCQEGQGKVLQMSSQLYKSIKDVETAQGSLTDIFRLVNQSQQK